jgi:hypothetical protein
VSDPFKSLTDKASDAPKTPKRKSSRQPKKNQKSERRPISKKLLIPLVLVLAIIALAMLAPYVSRPSDPRTTIYLQTTTTATSYLTTYTCSEIAVINGTQSVVHYVTLGNTTEYDKFVSGTSTIVTQRILEVQSSLSSPC